MYPQKTLPINLPQRQQYTYIFFFSTPKCYNEYLSLGSIGMRLKWLDSVFRLTGGTAQTTDEVERVTRSSGRAA